MSVPFPPTLRIVQGAEHMDVAAIQAFLSRSYWSPGVPLDVVRRAVQNSLCFGVFDGVAQVGFARVITDRTSFAYLCDVYVLEDYRGRGLAKALIAQVLQHPELQGLRRFQLITRDAHDLYQPFGFRLCAHPERVMEMVRPDIYLKPAGEVPDER